MLVELFLYRPYNPMQLDYEDQLIVAKQNTVYCRTYELDALFILKFVN